jgi:hypothetical protein
MKKILVLFTLFFMVFLVSCNSYDGLDYYFGEYQVYYESSGTCEVYLNEVIYEDDSTTYYITAGNCDGESRYFILYNKEYIDIPYALEEGIITISQVVKSGLPALLIEEK